MKKNFSFTIVLLLFLALFSPNNAWAKSYSIDKVDIEAQVNIDGSMQVEEKRLYNFDGDYTFAYETFQINSDRGEPYLFENFQVCDETKCYEELNSEDWTTIDEKKPSGSFYVDAQNNQYYIKWFYRANNSTKTFTIKYKVANAVTLNQDVAEIYWQWIGKTWEVSQSNISATVSLPDGIGENIKAYGHGPLNGIVKISDDSKTVTFTAAKLYSGDFFEGRIIVPKELFIGGATGNLTKLQIESEEKNFIDRTVNRKKQELSAQIILSIISVGIFLLGMSLATKRINELKRGKNIKLPEVNLSGRLWEPPSDIDPAQVEQIINGYKTLTPKSFTATILSLVQHRFYKITRSNEKQGFWIWKDYKYFLEPLEKSDIYATSTEKYVLDFLKDIGEGTLGLDEITEWCRVNRVKSYKFFKKFPEIVFDENIYEGFFDAKSHEVGEKTKYWDIVLIIIAEFILIIMSGTYNASISVALSSIFFCFLFFVIAAIAILKAMVEKRTEAGAKEAANWIAFKKHMEEYNQTKNYPIDSIILWEKYLVYGTVLGVSTKALSALPINFTDTDKTVLVTTWGGNFDGSNVSMSGVFSSVNSMMNAMTTLSTSSYGASGSGSSGGFSGGGGGGGGASGGGAG